MRMIAAMTLALMTTAAVLVSESRRSVRPLSAPACYAVADTATSTGFDLDANGAAPSDTVRTRVSALNFTS